MEVLRRQLEELQPDGHDGGDTFTGVPGREAPSVWLLPLQAMQLRRPPRDRCPHRHVGPTPSVALLSSPSRFGRVPPEPEIPVDPAHSPTRTPSPWHRPIPLASRCSPALLRPAERDASRTR